MQDVKNQKLEQIASDAYRKTGRLARELIHAEPLHQELILAEMEFNRWLAGSCDECLP